MVATHHTKAMDGPYWSKPFPRRANLRQAHCTVSVWVVETVPSLPFAVIVTVYVPFVVPPSGDPPPEPVPPPEPAPPQLERVSTNAVTTPRMTALRRLKQQNNSAAAPANTTLGPPPSRIPDVGAVVVIDTVEVSELFVPGDIDVSDHVDGLKLQLAFGVGPSSSTSSWPAQCTLS